MRPRETPWCPRAPHRAAFAKRTDGQLRNEAQGRRTIPRARYPTDRGRSRHGQGYTRLVNITCRPPRRSSRLRFATEGRRVREQVTSRFLSRELTPVAVSHSQKKTTSNGREPDATHSREGGSRFNGDDREPSLLLFIIFPGAAPLHGARSTPHALAAAATRTFVVSIWRARTCARAGILTGNSKRREVTCKFPKAYFACAFTAMRRPRATSDRCWLAGLHVGLISGNR